MIKDVIIHKRAIPEDLLSGAFKDLKKPVRIAGRPVSDLRTSRPRRSALIIA
jgi:hypothetical protein